MDVDADYAQPGKTPDQLGWLRSIDWAALNEAINRPRDNAPTTPAREEPDMGLFKSFDSPAFPREITDGNGHVWRNSEGVQPGRNGEPVYYPVTRPEGWSLTPSEIEAEHGRRR